MVRRPNERSGAKDEPDLPPNIFVIGLLHDLKEGGYGWRAWAAFWRASWVRSMQIFGMSDQLRASWLRFTVVGVIGIALAALGVFSTFGLNDAIWFLISSLLWWAVLMFDLALHLGLMVNLESGELQTSLGWPNRLTELRGFAAVWVAWGAHWASQGSYVPLVAVFGLAAFTDLADGWLARRRHASTRWGRLYDPFMDGLFFSVAAISLAVIGILPQWLAALVTVRYAFPIVGGIAFLVVRRRTLRVRHTTWGRASSAGIALTVFAAAAATAFNLPFTTIEPVLYAVVAITAVGAFVTVLMKGIEQV
ncbi:MAG: CDP-alcohol phosphatidyltransferase family protein [Chloroflexi bacterium]|nr:MAG: CDP-alcohol phosphatidyltransferase family protein [Chloroflexota bacterium]